MHHKYDYCGIIMGTQETSAQSTLSYKLAFISIFIGLLALNIWIFFVQGQGTWQIKAELLLEFIAFYTFVFGFLTQTGILKNSRDLENIVRDMTSPNLYEFTRGNFVFLAILFSSLAEMLEPRKTQFNPFYLLELPLLLVVGLLMFVYAAIHIVVIIPMLYIPYAIVSVPIRNIQTSADTIGISYGNEMMAIKNIVSSNVVSIRNLLIAVPAAVFSLMSKIILTLGWNI